MKLVKANDQGKIHVVAVHNTRTLCNDQFEYPMVVPTGLPTCKFCIDVLLDLRGLANENLLVGA